MKETSNLLCPYEIRDNGDFSYKFITEGGIEYIAYFIGCENYHEKLSGTYMFNFEHAGCQEIRKYDSRIKPTVMHIVESFFRNNLNSMIYICDSLDGKEVYRKRLFQQWYTGHSFSMPILKKDLDVDGESYKISASLLVHNLNPDKDCIIDTFLEIKDLLID